MTFQLFKCITILCPVSLQVSLQFPLFHFQSNLPHPPFPNPSCPAALSQHRPFVWISVCLLGSLCSVLFIIEKILKATLSVTLSLSLVHGGRSHLSPHQLDESFTRLRAEWGNTSHLISSHTPPLCSFKVPLLLLSLPRRPTPPCPPASSRAREELHPPTRRQK